MTTQDAIIARVRTALGDFGQPFRDTFAGTGELGEYDLTETRVSGVTIMAVSASGAADLVDGTDFEVDSVDGRILLSGAYDPLPVGTTLVVNGTTAGMFTDAELAVYVNEAFLQHTHDRTVQMRYQNAQGFIQYSDVEMTYDTLPEIEEQLVALLATVECLWDLTTDASTDMDISTSEGTHLPRSQRYAQMRNQIEVLTEKYHTLCQQLNVGLFRIEVTNLRRVSRTNNRLVPVYKEREYDDNTFPTRLLPPIDEPHLDKSGLPSTIYGGNW